MPSKRPLTPVPTSAELQAGRQVTRAQAVALIVSRDGVDNRICRDKARHLLNDHVERELLKQLDGARFDVSELGRWLNEQWPGLFPDVPANAIAAPPAGAIGVNGFAPVVFQTPGTLEGCRQEIGRLHGELAQLRAENAELRAAACSRQDLHDKLSLAGKEGGRGRSK